MKTLKVSAIKVGTVIDHIPSEATFKIVDILGIKQMNQIITVGVNLQSKRFGTKGIIKIGDKVLTKAETDKIALISPSAVINIIEDYKVVKKSSVTIPDIIESVARCSNPNCVTNHNPVPTRFYTLSREPLKLRCHYCERIMREDDVSIL